MKKELSYINENFKIMLKSLIEYKSNFYSSFLEQLFYYVSLGILLFVLYDNFASLVGWKLEQFIFYMVLYDFVLVFVNLFFWGKDLVFDIPSGDLSQYINKPINPLIAYIFSRLSAETIFQVIISLVFFVLLSLYFNIFFHTFIISVVILLMVSLLFLLFKIAFTSFAFYGIGFTKYLYRIENNFFFIMQQYPTPFFMKTKLARVLMFYPFFFIGSLLIPLLSETQIWNICFQLSIISILMIVFLFIGLINWKQGLKKYEAYG